MRQLVQEQLTQVRMGRLSLIKASYLLPFCILVLITFSVYLVNGYPIAYIGSDSGFHKQNGWMWWHSFPRLIQTDQYSWLVPSRVITHTTWLYDLFLYGLSAYFGRYYEIIAFSILFSIFVISCVMLIQKQGAKLYVAICLSTIVMFCSLRSLYLTPQIIGDIFFVWSLNLVEQYRKTDDKHFWWKWTLLLVVWTNFHPDFPLTAAMLIGLAIDKTRSRQLLYATLGEIIGVVVFTPDHFGTLLYPFQMLIEPTNQFIGEWKSTALFPYANMLFIGLVAVGFMIFWSRKEKSVFKWLIWIAFTWLAYQHIRQLPYFLILAALWLPPIYHQEEKEKCPFLLGMLFVSIIALMIVLAQKPTDALYMNEGRPVEAVKYIQSHQLENHRWFCTYNDGSYIIGADPKMKIFIDGRQDVYTGMMEFPKAYNWVYVDYALEVTAKLGVHDMKNWGVEYALVKIGSPLERQLEGTTNLVYADTNDAIFALHPKQILTLTQIKQDIQQNAGKLQQ